jgi:formylglycine-generating enzyme required for sulfatase activity
VEYGWFKDNANGRTFPVAQRKPNPWGLHDMHGNVAEWCQDLFGDYLKIDETDPTGPAIGTKRVTRGGSCLDAAPNCRSASRAGTPPDTRDPNAGFRVVMVVNRGS